MLFKQRSWKGLAGGTVTVTFRRWKRPQARVGGRYRTPAGVLAVDAVERVDAGAITETDTRRAGYGDRPAGAAGPGEPARAWTTTVLRLIGDRPGVRAAELAASIGRDRHSFKLDVRKLEELGFTESLDTGYRLSRRGRALRTRFDEM